MAIKGIDQELIRRCQKGDEAAFELLYNQLKDDLFRWIYSLMRDYKDAQEVFQECAIRIFRHIGSLKDPSRFNHWLFRLVVNQCNTHRTRKGRLPDSSLAEEIKIKPEGLIFKNAVPENPRRALMRKELMKEINRHIANLPKKQRLAVMLFDVEGFSIKEIAQHLGCSEGAVKFNIHEGRKKLRSALGHLADNIQQITPTRGDE